MSDITDALDRLGVLVRAIDPSPSPSPRDDMVFVYPADYEKIPYTPNKYPFAVVSQFIFGTQQLQTRSIGGGSFRHNWTASVDVYLGKEIVTGKDIKLFGAQNELLQHSWPVAFETVITTDLSLNGTVDQVGNDRTYVIGNLSWRGLFTAWGIRFLLPILTTIDVC